MKSITAVLFFCCYVLVGFFGLFYKGPERPELQNKASSGNELAIDEIDRQGDTIRAHVQEIEALVNENLKKASSINNSSKKLLLEIERRGIVSLN